LHAGNWTVPRQLMVRAPGGGNTVTKLPHGTSLLDLRVEPPVAADRAEKEGLRQESGLRCHARVHEPWLF
jgi:hypothetical protein